MPSLIDLKTDFRSLKFGMGKASDKSGGGYSNQPYIVKPIPDYDDDDSSIFNTGGPDFLLRGGLTAPIKAVDDVSRLTQMFFDLKSPNGLLFTAKQNVLSRTSVKTEASKGLGTAGGTVNQGLYLPTSTILQSGTGFTGTHLNLLGLNPFSPGLDNNSLTSQLSNGGLVKYETAAKEANLADNNTFNTTPPSDPIRNPLFDTFNQNNPLILGTIQPNPFPEFLNSQIPEVSGNFKNRLLDIWHNKQQVKNDDPNVITYSGGPGSILGVGKTNIKFAGQSASDRTGVNNPLSVDNPSMFYGTKKHFHEIKLPLTTKLFQSPNININSNEVNTQLTGFDSSQISPYVRDNNLYNELDNGLLTNNKSGDTNLQDFRTSKIGTAESPTVVTSNVMSLSPNYKVKNIENRVGLGDPGKSRNVLKYSVDEAGLDLINSRPFYSGKTPDHMGVGNDLAKFTIGLLNNDGTGESNFIQFRAYIDNFSDTYGADWGEVQYVGRGDKFYNYKGFNRSISMGWTVHASSKGELIPMYKKLNYLATGLAPDYSSGGYMKGNLARLTVGGYLYNQLGIIKSLTYTIPQESTWEIGIDEKGGFDHEVKELPHMIKITGFEFIPIQYDVTQKGLTKFIQLSAGGKTNWSKGMQMPGNSPIGKGKNKQKLKTDIATTPPKSEPTFLPPVKNPQLGTDKFVQPDNTFSPEPVLPWKFDKK